MKVVRNNISLLVLWSVSVGCVHAGAMGDISTLGNDKHFFATVTPLYGSINDGGINENPLADTITATGAVDTISPKFVEDWGFALGVGYRYGADKNNALILNYMNFSTNGTTNASVATGSSLVDRMGMLVEDSSNSFFGPATTHAKTHDRYQTGELLSQRWFQNPFISNVQFSRFWGIKASYFKKSLDVQYHGVLTQFSSSALSYVNFPTDNTIDYDAKFYGIGPKIGMGAQWNINHIFSIGGDLSAAALGGSQKSRWDETLTTNADVGFDLPPAQQTAPTPLPVSQYSYKKTNDTSLWMAPMWAGNLVASANFGMSSGSSLRIDGGIGFEAYLPDYNIDVYNRKNGANSVSISEHIAIRTVFLKFSYLS